MHLPRGLHKILLPLAIVVGLVCPYLPYGAVDAEGAVSPVDRPVDQVAPDGLPPVSAPGSAGVAALPRHPVPALQQATPLGDGAQAASDPVILTVVLNRADPAGLETLVRGVQ